MKNKTNGIDDRYAKSNKILSQKPENPILCKFLKLENGENLILRRKILFGQNAYWKIKIVANDYDISMFWRFYENSAPSAFCVFKNPNRRLRLKLHIEKLENLQVFNNPFASDI